MEFIFYFFLIKTEFFIYLIHHFHVVVICYIVHHYCLSSDRGAVHIVVVGYIVHHYWLRFAIGVVCDAEAGYIGHQCCLRLPRGQNCVIIFGYIDAYFEKYSINILSLILFKIDFHHIFHVMCCCVAFDVTWLWENHSPKSNQYLFIFICNYVSRISRNNIICSKTVLD